MRRALRVLFAGVLGALLVLAMPVLAGPFGGGGPFGGNLPGTVFPSITITGGSITGITDLAVADGGTGASSFAAAHLPVVTRGPSSDYTNSTTTPSNVTGCSFTPTASKMYDVEVRVTGYTAATTTGIEIDVDATTAAASGGGYLNVQGASNAAQTVNRNGLGTVLQAIGGSAPTSPGRVLSFGHFTFTAAASPGAFQVQAASEVGASQITIPTNECVIVYTCLDC